MKKTLLGLGTLMIACAVIFSISCKKPADPAFAASKTSVAIGEAVTFTATNTDLIKNATFVYDFGDGTNSNNAILASNESNARNASHVYSLPGTYTVTQTVYYNNNSAKGKSSQKSVTATIEVTGVVAGITPSKTACTVNEAITLTNSSTGADAGFPVSYAWSAINEGGATGTFKSLNPQDLNQVITFAQAGKYKVTLIATQNGYVNRSTVTITVTDALNADLNGAVGAALIGNWSVGTDQTAVTGSTGGTYCPSNTTTTAVNTALKVYFVASGGTTTHGDVLIVPVNGSQIPAANGSWDLYTTGILSISGSSQVSGYWDISGSSTASPMTLKTVDVQHTTSCGTVTTTHTISMTKN